MFKPDGKSGNMSASGAGGMGFKSRADQLPTHCQRHATAATLMCGPWRKAAELGTGHL